MTNVHVIDDDAAFRTAIGRPEGGRRLRGGALASSAAQPLVHLPGEDQANCILLDVEMPEISGTELQDRLAARAPLPPIVFLTGNGDIQTSVRAIRAGAEDFLTAGRDRAS